VFLVHLWMSVYVSESERERERERERMGDMKEGER